MCFRIRGTCKHVGALFHYIISKVVKGENSSVTSQHQTWDKPASSRLHEPDFIQNIVIKKLHGDCGIDQLHSSSNQRFNFDPRPPAYQVHRSIHDYNLDSLAQTTGDSAILWYAPRKKDAELFIAPNLENVWLSEEVVSIHTFDIKPLPCIASQILHDHPNITLQEFHLLIESKLALTPSESEHIQHHTMDQHSCHIWREMRVGRLSASKMKECFIKIQGGELIGKTKSLLKDIMGYRDSFSSPATSWGLSQENSACDSFMSFTKKDHSSLRVSKCGLIISPMCPFVCGTPDFLVSCSCHCTRPLEVKNPWKHRALTIHQYVHTPDSCLHLDSDSGNISLKKDHAFYFQVQTQVFVTQADSGYFCLQTASPIDNCFVQEISCDQSLIDLCVFRDSIFFKCAIVPEFFSQLLFKESIIQSILKDIL